ncbi:hypothetical protein BDA96_07G058600 [Sorghum bicolor]|uniref:Elongin-A n=2 Tax=Sorghum bicolor TaxID=4558 RepID=A0A921QL00_SORBI|nr:uncharacterized protein LOC8080879 [Sorghum bicolor]XP_021320354.1 uncharacterized protein LOC8080879 [Sorghum bicolor]XP_021320355.1 uncharacterized protein LOC8080879 [Sorghum bicolor]KAG0522681.1 hypothetical protein BDA96_07G058600 [Sorghum bicolor]KAG0522682.1 hypothetical protein BDA96_07G058600 [Sorghum bicolor]KXG24534.1 hypothetical protein SORBI_3007G056100 [Sorghum bicolor]KXG24535.1 hypothetical protein SORBI_3007G056100 [Sorghum bicolor]|eukprot:XP_002443929.2 uncharacterized protein LOC8080879 [Sorghum bicolor]
MEFGRRKPMSLLELCIRKAIDNLRYIESVDGIEMDLLKRILPHCTLEHLTKIEENTKMDLSSVTDPLWKRFYFREFGEEHTNKVIARLKSLKETRSDTKYTWWKLFEARQKKQKQAEDEMVEKFTKKFQAEKAEKQSKQIKLCTKVPPSSKRSFFGGSGPSSLSNCSYKSPMLKKARMEATSQARLQSAIQKNTFARSSQPIRTTSFSGQPVRTTTIHRPNSTITTTKPIHRPNSTITDTKPIHRPNSTITTTKPIHRPNSTITTTKPMVKSRQIQNSKLMEKSRQIQNSRPKF